MNEKQVFWLPMMPKVFWVNMSRFPPAQLEVLGEGVWANDGIWGVNIIWNILRHLSAH